MTNNPMPRKEDITMPKATKAAAKPAKAVAKTAKKPAKTSKK